MKIGTRLTLAFFGVALIPLVLSAVLTIILSIETLTTEVLNHLDSVATIQTHRIEQSVSQNYDKLHLIKSRTSLLSALDRFLSGRNENDRDDMIRVIVSARDGVKTFEKISVLTTSGEVVASTDPDEIGRNLNEKECLLSGLHQDSVHIFLLDDNKKLRTHFSGPLILDQRLLGVVVITDNTDYLLSLVSDYTGLGKTGETLLARKNENGDALFLTPLRFDTNAALVRIEPDMSRPINIALSKGAQTINDAFDYRGVPVFAATRYLPDLGWGLVAKIDRAEALEPIDALRNSLIVILIFAAIAIGFVSYYLAHNISAPIIAINRVASAISKGDYSQRAPVTSKDEIGMLAVSFNKMSDDLIVANYGLERRVNERTEELRKATEEIRRLNADLERKVIERTAQLQLANAELDSFSYSVSHDLRAPLRGIDGWSHALMEDYREKLDAQGQQYIDHVRAEAQRMGQLIDDMLKLARVTRSEIHWKQVNLTELAQSITVRLLREAPLERQVEFVIQPGVIAHGDDLLLEIALFNLIDNAWKFTGTRSVGRIEFGRIEQEGKPVFFVRDNGVGFDMTYASKLFGAFQRLHKLSEFPGTGIGLATVQRIIHRHGGRVWAEAQIDKGATFYFTIKEEA